MVDTHHLSGGSRETNPLPATNDNLIEQCVQLSFVVINYLQIKIYIKLETKSLIEL